MKRIVIDIYDDKDSKLNGLIEIESKELDFKYANGGNYHGISMFDCSAYWKDAYESILVEINDKIRLLNEVSGLIRKGE